MPVKTDRFTHIAVLGRERAFPAIPGEASRGFGRKCKANCRMCNRLPLRGSEYPRPVWSAANESGGARLVFAEEFLAVLDKTDHHHDG